VAVIGVGHLGSRHARRLSEASRFRLLAVYDRRGDRARAVAGETGCRAAAAAAEAWAEAEAVVVATDTSSHFEAVAGALSAGKHVLVEKPLTGRIDEAEILVAQAEAAGRVLQVGQVERFNPALRALLGHLPRPLFVESHRLASLAPRNLDLDVVQDLMVHDIDLTLAFVGEDPVSVESAGVPVMTGRVDIANARLRFPGGTVANLTASRVSLKRVRKFRMFLPGTYVSADCAAGVGEVFSLREGKEEAMARAVASGEPLAMLELLDHRRVDGDGGDALSAEHEAFRRAVRGLDSEGVSGAQALRTLRVMTAVEDGMQTGARTV
jgi:predicted dehydrogenase